MSNYQEIQNLITEYQSILTLCQKAGVKMPEVEWKLSTCLYMLGMN